MYGSIIRHILEVTIKYISNVCRLNFHQKAPYFQGNAYFIKISTEVFIDFVSESQQMKLTTTSNNIFGVIYVSWNSPTKYASQVQSNLLFLDCEVYLSIFVDRR